MCAVECVTVCKAGLCVLSPQAEQLQQHAGLHCLTLLTFVAGCICMNVLLHTLALAPARASLVVGRRTLQLAEQEQWHIRFVWYRTPSSVQCSCAGLATFSPRNPGLAVLLIFDMCGCRAVVEATHQQMQVQAQVHQQGLGAQGHQDQVDQVAQAEMMAVMSSMQSSQSRTSRQPASLMAMPGSF